MKKLSLLALLVILTGCVTTRTLEESSNKKVYEIQGCSSKFSAFEKTRSMAVCHEEAEKKCPRGYKVVAAPDKNNIANPIFPLPLGLAAAIVNNTPGASINMIIQCK